MEEQYRVVFKGEIAPKADPLEVRQNLAALYKVDIKEAERFFSGKRFVLKENASLETARQYAAQFEAKTGTRCAIVKMEKPGQDPPPAQEDTAAESKNSVPGQENTFTGYETRYRLMFKGELVIDKDINEVKTNLSLFYNVKPDRIESLFTGRPVTIKEPTDFWTAAAYYNRFKECGIVCYLEPVDPVAAGAETTKKSKIVFCGELQEGHDLLSVKARLAALFKVPGVVADRLFQGKPVLVRTGLPLDTAQSFKKEFDRTGARCQMLEVSAQPQVPAPAVQGVLTDAAAGEPPPPGTRISFPSSPSPAAAGQQFGYRQPSTAPTKNNTLVIFVSVVIMAAVLIFLISLFKKSSTEDLPASPGQTVTSRPSSRHTARPASPSPPSQPDSKRGLLSENTVPFQDPKNYYLVYLPEGCKLMNKSSGQRSKITYNYSFNTSVTIIATPMNKAWDPQKSMVDKVTAIQEGKAGDLSRHTIDRFGLVNFNNLDGYEIVLSGKDQLAHAYALVSPNKIAFSISIVTLGGYKQENHDILDSAIRSSLNYQ